MKYLSVYTLSLPINTSMIFNSISNNNNNNSFGGIDIGPMITLIIIQWLAKRIELYSISNIKYYTDKNKDLTKSDWDLINQKEVDSQVEQEIKPSN